MEHAETRAETDYSSSSVSKLFSVIAPVLFIIISHITSRLNYLPAYENKERAISTIKHQRFRLFLQLRPGGVNGFSLSIHLSYSGGRYMESLSAESDCSALVR